MTFVSRIVDILPHRLARRLFPDLRRRIQDQREITAWVKRGKPARPPHAVKAAAIRSYAERFGIRTLIETGTYRGDMVEACRRFFHRVVSIELSRELADEARKRFAGESHISIMQGDSSALLPTVLARIDGPCIFWLDAHYSGGITAQGEVLTPIFQELDVILRFRARRHVILIDDAGDFVGTEGYPTVEELEAFVRKSWPDCHFEVRDDIIRICRE